MSSFQFKKFTIHQDRCAMKIGSDAIAFGASINCSNSFERVLDIGTGTGILALMLAQRFPNTAITAIEIVAEAAEQARENAMHTEFASQITVINTALQDFEAEQKFHRIISNPPFFVAEKSLSSPDENRRKARSTGTLSYDDLLHYTQKNLLELGYFEVMLPCAESENFIEKAKLYNLRLVKKIFLLDNVKKTAHRVFLVFIYDELKQSRFLSKKILILKNLNGTYSDNFRGLTEAFYL